MGLFDKMFGRDAEAAEKAPNAQARFDALKSKYQSALSAVEQQRVQLQNLHVQDNKLFLRGIAPSEDAKNAVWSAIKAVDASLSDVTADFSVAPPSVAPTETYTVKSGDSLSKIAKQYYGSAYEFMRIFNANRDKLKDPNLIHPGDVLKIPKA